MILLFLSSVAVAQTPDQDYWNKVFREGNVKFKRLPSPLLIQAIEGRKPGDALDLGMGEGRNSIFLAQKGWQVTGVDFSDVAVAQARQQATKLGLQLRAFVQNLDTFDFGRERWDLIALFYMHGWLHTSATDPPKRLVQALRPGGLLVIESYGGGQTGFQTNELLRLFDQLQVVYYQDLMAEAEWSPGRTSRVIRFVAERPP